MIKKLLLGATIAVSSMTAQTGKIVSQTILLNTPNNSQESITQGKLPATCFTISTITGTALSVSSAGSDTSVPGCSPKAGYVYGSNCYKDKEKANFFASTNYSSVTQPSVSQVVVFFYGTGAKGTMGTASVSCNLALYAGTSATSAPVGAALATSTANLGQIVAAHTNTANNIWTYTYNFVPSIAIPNTGFFTSVIVPVTIGDTAVVANDPAAPSNIAWERGSDNLWYGMNPNWGPAFKGNIAMMPTVCGNTVVTGVSTNSAFSKNITLMPNPSSGLVNISVILTQPENLNVTVTNALGQVINSTYYQSVTNNNLSLDLTNSTNGVYTVIISNGKDKMVQRLIISK